MKKFSAIILGFTLFFLLSCSTNRVISDYERGIDFTDYQTFKLLKPKKTILENTNPINYQRLKRAVLREMQYLGYQIANDPDLVVSCYIRTRQFRTVDHFANYYGWWPSHNVDIREYEEGSIVIDLIDPKRKKVVWHGVSAATIRESDFNQEEKINRIVHAIFEKFAEESVLIKPYAGINLEEEIYKN